MVLPVEVTSAATAGAEEGAAEGGEAAIARNTVVGGVGAVELAGGLGGGFGGGGAGLDGEELDTTGAIAAAAACA